MNQEIILVNECLNALDAQNPITRKLSNYLEAAHYAMPLNSYTVLYQGLKRYINFCVGRYEQPFPASGEMAAHYIRWMRDTQGYKLTTIKKRVSALTSLHKSLNLLDPAQDAHYVTLELKRIKTYSDDTRKQAVPLRWSDVTALCKTIRKKTTRDYTRERDQAIFRLAYDSLMRVNELIKVRLSDFEPEGDHYVVRARVTKTTGGDDWRFVHADTMDQIREMVKVGGVAAGGFIFRGMNKMAIRGEMTRQGMSLVFSSKGYSSHSCRVGAAIDQREAGFSIPEICQSGGWKGSAMPLLYTEKISVASSGSSRYAKVRAI